ncbi:MAG: 50S ribosomal protein L4 [Candidatus Colwellbacteria bacterium]|nr:50S ribosomal protein L4 [Candidatus Colwellbacteria bacterium]
MTTDLYNQEGKVIDKIDLPDRVFSRPWNPDLVHQALRVQMANRRQVLAHAKDRSEVRGGGKKPWAQKHTGRARHGSIRSPIWKGGGVTHGPTKDKKYSLRINKKMRQAAILAVLSERLKEGEIKFIDSLKVEPKTKNLSLALSKFFDRKPNVLLIPDSGNKNIYGVSRNLEKVKSLNPKSLNVYDLLKYKNILVEKEAVSEIEKHYHAVK